jgi:hypothetical protein
MEPGTTKDQAYGGEISITGGAGGENGFAVRLAGLIVRQRFSSIGKDCAGP